MTITGLTPDQLEFFDREGCICIENFLSKDQVNLLMGRSHDLLKSFDVSSHPKTKFLTGEDGHIGDQYFFDSADKVSFFFDTDAFDEKGELRFPKEMAVNKIGHFLHNEPIFHEITFDDKVKEIARSLKYEDPRVLQSMLIFKHPVKDKGSLPRDNAVPLHTDGTFLFTKPQSAVGFWYALEDCTIENGCLSYGPGTHKTHSIKKRFVKKNGGDDGCDFINVDYEVKDEPEDKPENYKTIECKAGSLILIHNSVLHKSEKNQSEKSRFAYAFHIIDGTAEYDNLNWLQVPPCKEGGTNFTKLYEECV